MHMTVTVFKAALILLAAGIVSTPANAKTFTFDQAGLLDMELAWDNGGEGTLDSVFPTEHGGAEFVGTIIDPGEAERSIGIGYSWPPPGLYSDLSEYSKYRLRLDNPDDEAWSVNLFMNTGWTGSPFNEDPKFYESVWTLLNPGESIHLEVDLSGVEYLNHVTGIGFQVAALGETAPGGTFRIRAGVPVPGVVLLLGAGLLALAVRRSATRSSDQGRRLSRAPLPRSNLRVSETEGSVESRHVR
jgi:hypothetical protein